ncbi:VOC family protein [Actinoplanes couchii]|uniref:Glyoxalase-like domain-containing protein n=1 Tax=Actinoplanes couchii TaxID=403638 RepID=A0ABQ3X2N7_9ACTN|nr:hypothetical protein Aco03nite_011800 [Actinoplanes couchii]
MIRWVSACIDRPVGELGVAAEFWSAVTGCGIRAENVAGFVGLTSSDSDEWLEIQGVHSGSGGVHLDLSVDDVRVFSERAVAAGASVVADHGVWRVLASPAGLLFCVAPWKGESRRPRPFRDPAGGVSRVHQVCLDVPPSRFDAEVDFWASITGWERDVSGLPVFSRLWPVVPVPVRVLFQRLGEERAASAHLDVASADRPATRGWHETLGAVFVGEWPAWTTMRDPAGGVYCLTRGDPTVE